MAAHSVAPYPPMTRTPIASQAACCSGDRRAPPVVMTDRLPPIWPSTDAEQEPAKQERQEPAHDACAMQAGGPAPPRRLRLDAVEQDAHELGHQHQRRDVLAAHRRGDGGRGQGFQEDEGRPRDESQEQGHDLPVEVGQGDDGETSFGMAAVLQLGHDAGAVDQLAVREEHAPRIGRGAAREQDLAGVSGVGRGAQHRPIDGMRHAERHSGHPHDRDAQGVREVARYLGPCQQQHRRGSLPDADGHVPSHAQVERHRQGAQAPDAEHRRYQPG